MQWALVGLVLAMVCGVAGQAKPVCLHSQWQAHIHEVHTGPPESAKGEVAIIYLDFVNDMYAKRELAWPDMGRDYYEHKFLFPKNGSMYIYRHFHGNVSRRECDHVHLTPDTEKPHPPCFTNNGSHHHTEIIGGVVLADVFYHEDTHHGTDYDETTHGLITLTKTEIPIDHREWYTRVYHDGRHAPTEHKLKSYHNYTRNLDPDAFHVPAICF